MAIIHDQTALGTVIREDWSKDHIKLVMIEERKRRRPICGEKNHKGLPCSRVPEERYNHYCYTHRNTGRAKSDIVGVGTRSLETPNITTMLMAKDEMREHFFRCQVCVSRTSCKYFSKDSHCVVEEEIFEKFVREAKENEDIIDLDLFTLYNAGLAFVRSLRANRVLSRITVIDAEDTRLDWMAVRNSKEFRDSMKSLGLSRKERFDQRKEEAGLGHVSSNISLSQIMSAVQERLDDDMKLIIRQEFEIEKKKTDKKARLLEADDDGFTDSEPVSSTDDSQ